jgi:hypothetical protein
MKETTLWATKIGAPSWQEDVITSTTDPAKLAAARAWAESNGFDRLREVVFDGSAPDFAASVNL